MMLPCQLKRCGRGQLVSSSMICNESEMEPKIWNWKNDGIKEEALPLSFLFVNPIQCHSGSTVPR